jgi:hypothetical protein
MRRLNNVDSCLLTELNWEVKEKTLYRRCYLQIRDKIFHFLGVHIPELRTLNGLSISKDPAFTSNSLRGTEVIASHHSHLHTFEIYYIVKYRSFQ